MAARGAEIRGNATTFLEGKSTLPARNGAANQITGARKPPRRPRENAPGIASSVEGRMKATNSSS
jgi:hypothetical protein